MPRESQKRMKGRTQVNDKDTFDFSVPDREVVARPVDPYERKYKSSRSSNIESFMNSFEAMSKAGMQANEMFKENQRKEGLTAAQRGEEAPKNAHWAFLESYDNYKGLSAVADYQDELFKIHEDNKNADVHTYDAAVDKLNQQYITGRTDAFINGFVPDALKVQEYYGREYKKNQIALKHDDALVDARKITRVKLKGILDSDMPEQDLRKFLTEMQTGSKAFKGVGLSRTEITREVVDVVGEFAPELLPAFDIPDESGIRPTDNEGIKDLVDHYKDSKKAEVETKTLTTAYDKVFSKFTSVGSGKTDWVKAVEALGDPKYREELGLDIKEAYSLQNMMRTQQGFEVSQTAQAREDSKVKVLNNVFELWNNGDAKGSLLALKSADLPEYDKFQIEQGLNKAQEQSNPLAYHSMITEITSGKPVQDSQILKGLGTKYSWTDMNRLIDLKKIMQSEDAKRVQLAVETIKKGLGKSMTQAETPANAERINSAVNALWDEIDAAKKEGRPVKDVLTEGNANYKVKEILQSFMLTPKEEIESMMGMLQNSGNKHLLYQAKKSIDSFAQLYLSSRSMDSSPDSIKFLMNNPQNKALMLKKWELFKQGNDIWKN